MRRKLRKITIAMTTLILAISTESAAFAGQWKQDTIGWWYEDDDGLYPVNQWMWIDGNYDGVAECYYFDNKGYCLMNTMTADGYTVNRDGAWTVNGEVQIKAVSQNSQKNAVSVRFERTLDGFGESATLSGINEQGELVWQYQTPKYEAAQLDRVSEIGIRNDMYYFVENGVIIALRISDGSLLWKNNEFSGSGTAFDFGSDGTLYISGYLGPDFFAVDKSGKTLCKIETFDNRYYWPHEVEYQGTAVVISFEGSPSGYGYENKCAVNLSDFSYSFFEENSLQNASEDVYEYANGQFLSSLTICHQRNSNKAELMFWHNYGASASDEDFFFDWVDGIWDYSVMGNRSKKEFHLNFIPTSKGMSVRVTCKEGTYYSWESGIKDEEWVSVEYRKK